MLSHVKPLQQRRMHHVRALIKGSRAVVISGIRARAPLAASSNSSLVKGDLSDKLLLCFHRPERWRSLASAAVMRFINTKNKWLPWEEEGCALYICVGGGGGVKLYPPVPRGGGGGGGGLRPERCELELFHQDASAGITQASVQIAAGVH